MQGRLVPGGAGLSATNPVLRDAHEYILVYCKEFFSRKPTRAPGQNSTISRDEFLEYTKSVWTFNTESAKRVNHPAPFPVELPYRLIQLYSFAGDVVLDPLLRQRHHLHRGAEDQTAPHRRGQRAGLCGRGKNTHRGLSGMR